MMICLCDEQSSLPAEFSYLAKAETDIAAVAASGCVVFFPNWTYVPAVPLSGRMLDGYIEVRAPVLAWNRATPSCVLYNVSPPSMSASPFLELISIESFPQIMSTRRVRGRKIVAESRFATDAVLVSLLPPQKSVSSKTVFTFLLQSPTVEQAVVPLFTTEAQAAAIAASAFFGARYYIQELRLVRAVLFSTRTAGFMLESAGSLRLVEERPPIGQVGPGLVTIEGIVVEGVKRNSFYLLMKNTLVIVLLHFAPSLPPLCGLRVGAKLVLHNFHAIPSGRALVPLVYVACERSRLEILIFSTVDHRPGVPIASPHSCEMELLFQCSLLALGIDCRFRKVLPDRILRIGVRCWANDNLVSFVYAQLAQRRAGENTGASSAGKSICSTSCPITSSAPLARVVSVTDVLLHPKVVRTRTSFEKNAHAGTRELRHKVFAAGDLFAADAVFLALFTCDSSRCSDICNDGSICSRTNPLLRDNTSAVAVCIVGEHAAVPLAEAMCTIASFSVVVESLIDSAELNQVAPKDDDPGCVVYLQCDLASVSFWPVPTTASFLSPLPPATAPLPLQAVVGVTARGSPAKLQASLTLFNTQLPVAEPFVSIVRVCYPGAQLLSHSTPAAGLTALGNWISRPGVVVQNSVRSVLLGEEVGSGPILALIVARHLVSPDGRDAAAPAAVVSPHKVRFCLRDVCTPDEMELYVNLADVPFPLGLLPGCTVCLWRFSVLRSKHSSSRRLYLNLSDQSHLICTQLPRWPLLIRQYVGEESYLRTIDKVNGSPPAAWCFKIRINKLIEFELEWRCLACVAGAKVCLHSAASHGPALKLALECDDGSSTARLCCNSVSLVSALLGLDAKIDSAVRQVMRTHARVVVSPKQTFSERGVFHQEPLLVLLRQSLFELEGCKFLLWAKSYSAPRSADSDYFGNGPNLDLLCVVKKLS